MMWSLSIVIDVAAFVVVVVGLALMAALLAPVALIARDARCRSRLVAR